MGRCRAVYIRTLFPLACQRLSALNQARREACVSANNLSEGGGCGRALQCHPLYDVRLGKRFADRVIGMSGGSVVYDGDPANLSDEQLKAIYGGKEWLQQ